MISQGIGGRGGNYSNLEPMVKIQMSKVKPIKLSTTPFLSFSAQSSKSGWRSYLLGMGKAWRSNSNLWGRPFLESVFLTCGASKILERHAQAMRYPWISFLTHPHGFLAPSRSTKRWSSLLHGLAIIYFDSPYSECILGVAGANGKEGATILGF